MKNYYSPRVLAEYSQQEPPHLCFIRAIEAKLYEKHLPFSGKILDIGCGDGFFADSVFQGQKINLGLDIKGSLWREAGRRGNYLKVAEYDGLKIPQKNNSFDTVVCNCVLEHVPQAQNLIKEMARVLKPGGKIVVTVVTDKFGEELFGTKIWGKGYMNWFNRKSVHLSNVAAEEWKNYFQKAGLRVIEAQGYMDQKHLCRWFDVSHYWGIINLLTRKATGRWVMGPSLIGNIIWKKITEMIFNRTSVKTESPYLFLTAEKIKTLG